MLTPPAIQLNGAEVVFTTTPPWPTASQMPAVGHETPNKALAVLEFLAVHAAPSQAVIAPFAPTATQKVLLKHETANRSSTTLDARALSGPEPGSPAKMAPPCPTVAQNVAVGEQLTPYRTRFAAPWIAAVPQDAGLVVAFWVCMATPP